MLGLFVDQLSTVSQDDPSFDHVTVANNHSDVFAAPDHSDANSVWLRRRKRSLHRLGILWPRVVRGFGALVVQRLPALRSQTAAFVDERDQ